ncbi:Zinc finger protein MAGPIE [Platanthera zijinensis]|uniref:Zinc finger protein MAGPIE n=1 Tax=Platanthera zijinensis TaxID=2320716 RepID=A0AAP0G1E7_9ASPA
MAFNSFSDPEAEVVFLSPRTLMESDRYVCEICSQGFQRDQNLQMHRRRHKLPWKMLRKETQSPEAVAAAARKRVFVCPEQSCLHHDPCHALGDLVGIKKHFRRKHSANKQWACERCSKAYAVHSDYKAHLKTCGTRGHSCDCGRVFSRVESFIQHQDSCGSSRRRSEPQTVSSASPSSDIQPDVPPPPPPPPPLYAKIPFSSQPQRHNIELQLLPPAYIAGADDTTELHLSIGPPLPPCRRLNNEVFAAKSAEDEDRALARQQLEMAERELAAARRIRLQAQAEFEKACALREAAARQINSILLQITCADCRNRLRSKLVTFGGGREGEERWLNTPESEFE